MDLLFRAKALLAARVMLMAGSCGGRGSEAPALQRATAFGPVPGNDDSAASGTYSWKGVPYASPPVGDLRWMPPVDPAPWTTAASIGAARGQAVGPEDCLYLDIWAPAGASTERRPVIVRVHGGSNITGYPADPVYDGAALACAANAVVVSVNYRVGIFGFLHLAQLRTGDSAGDSGNFAILDLVKALKFVQGNISAFGGDSTRVTLIGQSAGAVNVLALLTSPLVVKARPALFHRLVPISSGISTAATMAPGALPRQANTLLMQALIADGTVADAAAATACIAAHSSAEIAAYLRAKSPGALLATVRARLTPLGLSGSHPTLDGAVLAADPVAAIKDGRYLEVPVLSGNTRDEVLNALTTPQSPVRHCRFDWHAGWAADLRRESRHLEYPDPMK